MPPALPVATAVGDAAWDADLVAALERDPTGVRVVRRCVDLADLLATAASGQVRGVLVSAELRRLDRDALLRLAAARVAVVGVVAPGDEAGERALHRLGVAQVVASDCRADDVVRAVTAALATAADPAALARLVSDPGAALSVPLASSPLPPVSEDVPGARWGAVLAVWGPTGAPGRTTLAVGLAAELAERGRDVLLVDADVYGGVVAQVLGLLDEAPGLAGAARAAASGTLDAAGLALLAREVGPRLRVLTGASRADRWPELRTGSVDEVLTIARALAGVTVVDCGFCLEQDEELVYDTAAPRRNGATLAVLAAADCVVAVGSAGPVGLQRLVRGLSDLHDAVPGIDPVVVVNRLRPGALPGDPAAEARAALQRFAGVEEVHVVPDDGAALDAALAAGRTLVEVAPRSPARRAISDLAGHLLGEPVADRSRLGLRGQLSRFR